MSIPLMIYLGVVSFAGSVFNFIVLLVFLSKRHFLQVPDVFLLSVAISDCLACVIAMPVTLLAVSNGSWQFDFELCKMHASLFYTFGLVSITHLSAMAFEKYLTLFKSTSTNGYYLTKGQAVKIIAALWGYSLVFSLSPLVGWGAYGLGPENITCTLLWGASGAKDDTYYGAVFLGCFFVPVGFILFSYYHISKVKQENERVSRFYCNDCVNVLGVTVFVFVFGVNMFIVNVLGVTVFVFVFGVNMFIVNVFGVNVFGVNLFGINVFSVNVLSVNMFSVKLIGVDW
ncbi:rhodopsin, G0-coupled [Nematostella vectensis]|uniref:rhodopsin, G0-coupled n=1 Tax=Nematostella vectensis TaxID=45351 RepID=UPI0020774F7B|nr:rhodopsin, G0-coupled [Nematostella vectensis]